MVVWPPSLLWQHKVKYLPLQRESGVNNAQYSSALVECNATGALGVRPGLVTPCAVKKFHAMLFSIK